MATLPTFDCPVCRNPLTWDVVFAHVGVREAMIALVNAHADGKRLLRPMLTYIGLFAPAKTAMRYERVASLANELVEMMRPATIQLNGRIWPAPAEYWQIAFEEVVKRAHSAQGLRLPLNSHGYLLEVLAGLGNKAEAQAENLREHQRQGHAGLGSHRPNTVVNEPVQLAAVVKDERRAMPPEVRAELLKMVGKGRHAEPANESEPKTESGTH